MSLLLCIFGSELDMTETYAHIAASNMSREGGGHLKDHCCAVHLFHINIDTYCIRHPCAHKRVDNAVSLVRY